MWSPQNLISSGPNVSEDEEALIVNKEVFTKAKWVTKSG